MTKEIVTFCSVANVPNNTHWHLTTTKDINYFFNTWNLPASKMGEFQGSVYTISKYVFGPLSNNKGIIIIKWMNVTNGNTFRISKLEYLHKSSLRLVSGSWSEIKRMKPTPLNMNIMDMLHQVSCITFMVQKWHENVLRHVMQLPCASNEKEDDLTMTFEQDNKPPHFCFCWSTYPFC